MNTAKKKGLRVVVDTNIIVSALNFGGAPDRVIVFCATSHAQLFLSRFIINETHGVLVEKFGWKTDQTAHALALLARQAILVSPIDRLALAADEPDNRVLECAMTSKADYLVTGDKGLLKLKKIGQTKIVSAAQFIAKVNSQHLSKT